MCHQLLRSRTGVSAASFLWCAAEAAEPIRTRRWPATTARWLSSVECDQAACSREKQTFPRHDLGWLLDSNFFFICATVPCFLGRPQRVKWVSDNRFGLVNTSLFSCVFWLGYTWGTTVNLRSFPLPTPHPSSLWLNLPDKKGKMLSSGSLVS